jgi:hypothetical protein
VLNLAADVRLDLLSEFAGSYDNPGCMDASTRIISNGIDSISCYCGCPDSPAPAREILDGGSIWRSDLFESSDSMGGPIRVVLLEIEVDDPSGMRYVYDWPLDWSPSEILTVPQRAGDLNSVQWDSAGEIIDNPDDIQLLRDLADDVRDDQGGSYPETISVRDADGRYYILLFRDVIPADLAAKIEAFDR